MMRRSATLAAAGPRYGLFATLAGGLEELVTTLVAALAGVELRLRAPVATLDRVGAGWRARTADGGVMDADEVVIAGPAHVAAALLAAVAPALAGDLAAIPYRGVATVNLGLRRMELPESAGFVVPAVEGRAISACTFASRKFAGRATPGTALVRAAVGHELSEGGDEAVRAAAVADLQALLAGMPAPEATLVTRHPRALAQPVLGHAARVGRIRAAEQALPGLALVGNAYEGSGIPDVIAQADAAARRLTPAA
jgi:oxygen-dependent protoporphyrinogen oxidase